MACCHSCPRLCSRSMAYTLALGLGSVTLGTSRTLLLKFSENAENKYDFLPASVNLLAEALKLLFCLVMSVRVIVREGRSCRELGFASSSPFLSSLKWAVPAFLYFLDNLIAFYVMAYLQPVMTVLSSNLVILTTAVLFRIVLKRRLSWVQWAALVILFLSIVSLTTGSASSQNSNAVPGHHANLSAPSNSCLLYTQLLEQSKNSSAGESWASSLAGQAWRSRVMERLLCLGAGHILLLLQCFIAAMANIYNEKILKDGDQLTESIFIQNSKLYAFGVVFNGLTVWAQGLHHGLLHGHNVYSLGLVPVTVQRQHVPRADGSDHHRPGHRPLLLPLRLPPHAALLPPGSHGPAGHLYLQRQPAQRPRVQPAAGKAAGHQRRGVRAIPRGRRGAGALNEAQHRQRIRGGFSAVLIFQLDYEVRGDSSVAHMELHSRRSEVTNSASKHYFELRSADKQC
uniref:Solute carrier family 35 member A5 n=1 Tax=Amphiprion ocellaris TaxID=80972 RepID=A0A3Q1B1X4_AMPOC